MQTDKTVGKSRERLFEAKYKRGDIVYLEGITTPYKVKTVYVDYEGTSKVKFTYDLRAHILGELFVAAVPEEKIVPKEDFFETEVARLLKVFNDAENECLGTDMNEEGESALRKLCLIAEKLQNVLDMFNADYMPGFEFFLRKLMKTDKMTVEEFNSKWEHANYILKRNISGYLLQYVKFGTSKVIAVADFSGEIDLRKQPGFPGVIDDFRSVLKGDGL